MRYLLPKICLATTAVFAAHAADASEELIKMSQNPREWVMPTGNYANHRYSKLNQITAENVAKLQAAWTFSTEATVG
jgi:glucose dehydrogenase